MPRENDTFFFIHCAGDKTFFSSQKYIISVKKCHTLDYYVQ